MMTLRHPSILQTMGGDWMGTGHSAQNLIVLELCSLGDLRGVLKKFGKVCPWVDRMNAAQRSEAEMTLRSSSGAHTEKIGWASQIAQGVVYLHSRTPPILHMDLKCTNVLVAAGYQMKITDFGESERKSSTTARNAAGTPYFMAPEVFAGDGRFDERCDAYSFSLLLLEMHNHGDVGAFFVAQGGQKMSANAVMAQTANGGRPDLTRLKEESLKEEVTSMPAGLVNLVKKGWSQNPSDRPSFKEMKSELSRIRASEKLAAMGEG